LATDGETAPLSGGFVFDDFTSVTLTTALSAVSRSQRVSADNIANLETPGYQAQRVSFEDSLRQAVASGDPSSTEVTTSATNDPSAANGNNVNLDDEVVNASESQLQYSLLSTAVNTKFDWLSSAIKGG
jgi:flagellar basal-body rod protein FlgB